MRLKGETEVLVSGAGPVGLFAALSLSERGVDVEIVDKEWRGSVHSYALALHPQSLRLLDEYGAADGLIEQGHRVESIVFHEGPERLGALDIAALGGPFPYVLVAPQSALERALEERLKRSKITVLWNHQVQGIESADHEIVARVALMEKHSMGYPIARTEWLITKQKDVRASFFVGADGYHSLARKSIGARFEPHGADEAFAVFEVPCAVDLHHEAHVVFQGATISVVWPLGEQRVRFSFQVDPEAPPPTSLEGLREMLAARLPWFRHEVDQIHWATSARFERRLVDRFGRGRVWLAGDAAHVTGPVGAQSMNVGLREAHDLAERLSAAIKGGGKVEALEGYEAERLAEWRGLLEIDGHPHPSGQGARWAASRADRILPCLPASGAELSRMLQQLGLQLAAV